MQSDDHDVPHSPEWNSHLPHPIRHICLPARALVPTGCAFNRHRFLPPKKYHRKKKSKQKTKRATAGDEIKEINAPQNQSTMQEANDTQWAYLKWPDSPLSLLLLLPSLRLWQEASLIRLLLKLPLSSLNLEDERERERSEARDAESGAGMSGGAGALRRAGRAPSPRAAIVQTKDTSGPNYGNTSP